MSGAVQRAVGITIGYLHDARVSFQAGGRVTTYFRYIQRNSVS
jgi:hypothetical protein